MRVKFFLGLMLIISMLGTNSAFATVKECTRGGDLLCILDNIRDELPEITDQKWRDQITRDLIMRYSDAGYADKALPLIASIQNPDTRAMAIRAAGMGAAKHHKITSKADFRSFFRKLDREAKTITHDGARAIAYTYIAMAQAFAGLDADATRTASAMENSALRNKAFAETAEIQAERRDFNAAKESITHIDSLSFRDKAYSITAKIFIKNEQYDEALFMANQVSNIYKKSKILLSLSSAQINAEEARTKSALGLRGQSLNTPQKNVGAAPQ